MPRDFNSVIGSGCTPNVVHSPAYNLPDTYPIPSVRDSLRNRQGEGVVVLNPENFSASIGLGNQAIAVGTGAGTPIPPNPKEYRRSLAIHNIGPGLLYIGDINVTTSNGFPILVGEKIAIDLQATPGVQIYATSDSLSNIRILEVS